MWNKLAKFNRVLFEESLSVIAYWMARDEQHKMWIKMLILFQPKSDKLKVILLGASYDFPHSIVIIRVKPVPGRD